MKKYERPMVLVNEELTEGVYAASGESSACYNRASHDFQDHGAYFFAATNFQHNPDYASAHVSNSPVVTFYFNKNVNVLGLVANNVSAEIVSADQGVSVVTVKINQTIAEYGSLGSVALKIEKSSEDIQFIDSTIQCP